MTEYFTNLMIFIHDYIISGDGSNNADDDDDLDKDADSDRDSASAIAAHLRLPPPRCIYWHSVYLQAAARHRDFPWNDNVKACTSAHLFLFRANLISVCVCVSEALSHSRFAVHIPSRSTGMDITLPMPTRFGMIQAYIMPRLGKLKKYKLITLNRTADAANQWRHETPDQMVLQLPPLPTTWPLVPNEDYAGCEESMFHAATLKKGRVGSVYH